MDANQLIDESSPYLLQHAYNPVDWYPWGDEAFQRARKEDKPIIISIGYAACHWCHVMEKESFQDSAVAAFMNEHFISVKVDREERPDVDKIYMNAAQLISGSGGWPLNAITLPNGKPFFAGTYFPRDDWMELLKKINDLYTNNRKRVRESANKITQGIRESELVNVNRDNVAFKKGRLDTLFETLDQKIDHELGGFKGRQKFPLPVSWQYLLQSGHLRHHEQSINAVETTLNHMARGGIYDQIGGGFSRYSTDENWFAPHFEKMLYDNGQLISLYVKAYQDLKKPLYKEVVEETITFVNRELSHENGGFYSSLDADSEGEEGAFYVWTWHTLDSLLNDEQFSIARDYYGFTKEGNWEEDHNILTRAEDPGKLAAEYDMTAGAFQESIDSISNTLFQARSQRERPGTDDKILASWNALMTNGLVDAYRVFGLEAYLDRAKKNTDFVLDSMSRPDGGLYRNYKDGKASIHGFLDDYAYWIDALFNLYQATFDERWLNRAERLTKYTLKHFSDSTTQMFYYTSADSEDLIARKRDLTDNVTPSSNSVMACNLYLLGHYLGNKKWIDRSGQMLSNIAGDLADGGRYYSRWAQLYAWFAYNHYEVAIVGQNAIEKRTAMDSEYYPNVFFLGNREESELPLLQNKYREGSTIIYVCQNKVCKLPVEDPVKALELIEFK